MASRAVLTFAFSSHSSIEFTRKIAQILRKRPTFKKMLILPHWHFQKTTEEEEEEQKSQIQQPLRVYISTSCDQIIAIWMDKKDGTFRAKI